MYINKYKEVLQLFNQILLTHANEDAAISRFHQSENTLHMASENLANHNPSNS